MKHYRGLACLPTPLLVACGAQRIRRSHASRASRPRQPCIPQKVTGQMWEQAKGTIRTVRPYLIPAAAGGLVGWLGLWGLGYPAGRWFARACILIGAYAVFALVY